MKKNVKILLLVFVVCLFWGECFSAETLNWCGIYFQENNRSYLRIVSDDVGVGSSKCSIDEYNEGLAENRGVNVVLDFNKGRSVMAKWRKFSGHLIEVRGKYKNGIIDGVKFIRDLGH